MKEIATQTSQYKISNGKIIAVCRFIFCGKDKSHRKSFLAQESLYIEKCRENDIVVCCMPDFDWYVKAFTENCLIVDDCDCTHEVFRNVDNRCVFATLDAAIQKMEMV